MIGNRNPIESEQVEQQTDRAVKMLLFLHVPKAGGTSLSDWIFLHTRRIGGPSEGRWLKDGVFYYPSGFVRGPYMEDHKIIHAVFENTNVHTVLGHFSFGIHKQLRNPSTYMTLMRDPVERTISLYYFQRLIEKQQGSHQGVTLPPDMGLEEFVRNPPYVEVDNGQTRRISGVGMSCKQCPPDALEEAKKNIIRYFCIAGVLERLDETLVLLRRKLNWCDEFSYYPKNENPGRPSQIDLPRHVRQAIRDRNELDIELYDFVLGRLLTDIESEGAEFQQELNQFKKEQVGLSAASPD